MPIGKPHNLWKVVNSRTFEVRKAEVKARVLTETYTLQSKAAKYNKNETTPTCQLCENAVEDTEHFVLHCPATHDVRAKHMSTLTQYCSNITHQNIDKLTDNKTLLQLVLDCSHPEITKALQLKPGDTASIERISQQMIYKMHEMRTKILTNKQSVLKSNC